MNCTSDTNVVDVAVCRLRKKVGDPFAKKLIHTVRGVGYVLENRETSPEQANLLSSSRDLVHYVEVNLALYDISRREACSSWPTPFMFCEVS